MAAYKGVEVTFLETNKYRVTWEIVYYDKWCLVYKERGGVFRPTLPTIQNISGSADTDTSLVAAVSLGWGRGEAVVTYDSTFNIIAIGLFPGSSDYRFKEWRQYTGSAADARFDKYSYYVWKDPSTLTPLATPTGLNADQITSNSARTNWQAVENASNYKLQYKAAGDTVWTETYTD